MLCIFAPLESTGCNALFRLTCSVHRPACPYFGNADAFAERIDNQINQGEQNPARNRRKLPDSPTHWRIRQIFGSFQQTEIAALRA